MFNLVYSEPPSRNVVHLLVPTAKTRPVAGKGFLNRAKTRAVIWAAMIEHQVDSAYALERKVVTGMGKEFDYFQMTRVFEQMIRTGSPAIEDVASWPLSHQKTLPTLWLMDHSETLVPILRHPIWRLLGLELPSTKWLNKLSREHGLGPRVENFLATSSSEFTYKLFARLFEGLPDESALEFLTRALIHLRQSEQLGDLKQYLATLAALTHYKAPFEVTRMQPILMAVHAEVGSYVRKFFSHGRLVARSAKAIAISKGRLAAEGIDLAKLPDAQRVFLSDDAEFVVTPTWSEWKQRSAKAS